MKEPVYFLKLELENVRCFGKKAMLDLSDGNGNWRKWTVILGDNGTGKTTLLQLLAGFEQIDIFEIAFAESNERSFVPKFFATRAKINFSNQLDNVAASLDFSCGESSYFNQSINAETVGQVSGLKNENLKNAIVFGYGANRFMDNVGSSQFGSLGHNSETLLNEYEKLINAEEWLLNMDYAASRDSELKTFAIERKVLIIDVLKNILPDIQNIRFTIPTKERLTPSVQFLTEYGYWVSIHQLSLGYKTMVAWMVDLAARLFTRYPDSNNPLAEPAIVLVDEIDLHLHPKWQRNIFDYLSDKFPQTQFIVTAHSPLVVQSAPKDANIVVLRKEGDHVVIDNDVKSVQNWRLDQILSSDLFGGIPVRNNEVESMLKRRNELMGLMSLSTAEQKELDVLNKEIDKLPYAESEVDIEAKEIIRKAAEYFKLQGVH
ncbi:MAG: AAA family ATPase [Flavobacterium sp.]|nr:AAA family ATPase [Flavobacterium sp.]